LPIASTGKHRGNDKEKLQEKSRTSKGLSVPFRQRLSMDAGTKPDAQEEVKK
jgi:hypothetical protein